MEPGWIRAALKNLEKLTEMGEEPRSGDMASWCDEWEPRTWKVGTKTSQDRLDSDGEAGR